MSCFCCALLVLAPRESPPSQSHKNAPAAEFSNDLGLLWAGMLLLGAAGIQLPALCSPQSSPDTAIISELRVLKPGINHDTGDTCN